MNEYCAVLRVSSTHGARTREKKKNYANVTVLMFTKNDETETRIAPVLFCSVLWLRNTRMYCYKPYITCAHSSPLHDQIWWIQFVACVIQSWAKTFFLFFFCFVFFFVCLLCFSHSGKLDHFVCCILSIETEAPFNYSPRCCQRSPFERTSGDEATEKCTRVINEAWLDDLTFCPLCDVVC